MQFLILDLVY